jgi:hypothetical protein
MAKEKIEVTDASIETPEPKVVPQKSPEYVHVPGTVHINAYYGAVEEAKAKLGAAQAELDEAKRALEEKKQSSGLL